MNYVYDTGTGNNLKARVAKTTYFLPAAGTGSCDLTGKITEEYSYHAAGALTNKKMTLTRGGVRSTTVQASMGYDNEGRMSSLTYPGGQAVSYSFDALGRLSGMTDSFNNTLVSGVQYGVANELKNLTYTPAGGLPGFGETRQYNDLFQLKRLTVASGSTTLIDEGYNYPTAAGQNNGRIDSKTDYSVFPNETTSYVYDDVNRLKSYQIGSGDVVQYAYDGFGNRLADGGTSFGYDTSKNRLTQLGPIAGYYQYDANGNLTGVGLNASVQSLSYDAENRMVSALAATYPEYYGYAPDNKRVYKKRADNQVEEFTFYVGNRRLGMGAIYDDQTTLGITITPEYWFGGKKLAARDRLGSAMKTLPYGQERSGVVQNSDSFATYYRDKTTALDYADQRYYSAGMGRFTSPDPYVASGGVGDPTSWNRYAYVGGDPVNRIDPSGRYWCGPLDRNVESADQCYDPSLPNPGPSIPGTRADGTEPDAEGQTVDGLTYYNWGNSDPQYQKKITDLLSFVSENVDSDCSRWLLSGSAPNPLTNRGFDSIAELSTFLTSNQFIGYAVVFGSDSARVNNASTGSGVGGMAIIFNVRGSTYEKSAPRSSGSAFQSQIQGISPGSQRQGVFTLIHELAHYLSTPGFRSDGKSDTNVQLNNDDVWKNCQKTIKAARNCDEDPSTVHSIGCMHGGRRCRRA